MEGEYCDAHAHAHTNTHTHTCTHVCSYFNPPNTKLLNVPLHNQSLCQFRDAGISDLAFAKVQFLKVWERAGQRRGLMKMLHQY